MGWIPSHPCLVAFSTSCQLLGSSFPLFDPALGLGWSWFSSKIKLLIQACPPFTHTHTLHNPLFSFVSWIVSFFRVCIFEWTFLYRPLRSLQVKKIVRFWTDTEYTPLCSTYRPSHKTRMDDKSLAWYCYSLTWGVPNFRRRREGWSSWCRKSATKSRIWTSETTTKPEINAQNNVFQRLISHHHGP